VSQINRKRQIILQSDNTSRATQLIAGIHDLLCDTTSHFTVRDTSRQLSTQCVNRHFILYSSLSKPL